MAKFKKEIYRQTRELKKTHGLDLKKEDYLEMVKNFKRGNVWVPYTHSSDPRDNVGYIDELFYNTKTNSLWAVFDIVDEAAAERISSGLVKDVSVSMYDDEELGWILEHVALTMSPGFKPQRPFSELELKLNYVQCEGLNNFETIEVKNMAENENTVELEETEEEEVQTETPEVQEEEKVELEDVQEESDGTENPDGTEKNPDGVENPDGTEETVDLEESEVNIFKRVLAKFGKDEKVKNLENENANLKVELESTKSRVVELESVVKDAEEAVALLEEESRVREWNLTFDNFVGIKVVPAEREHLFERINDPDELKKELEMRPNIENLTKNKTIELENKPADDKLADLSDDEMNLVKSQGWDKPGKEKWLDHFLSNREKNEE